MRETDSIFIRLLHREPVAPVLVAEQDMEGKLDFKGERKMRKNLWLGYAMIIIGVILVLNNTDVLNINPQVMWALLFVLIGGLMLFAQKHMERGRMLRILGIVLIMIGALLFIHALFGLPAGFIGTLALWAIGGFFIALHFRRDEPWWPVIPGGTFFVLGVVNLLDAFNLVSGERLWFVFFLGIAFICWYLYLIRDGANRLAWAVYPAAGLTVFSLFILSVTWGGRLMGMLFPLSLVLLGVYVLYTNMKRN
jgi:hypothetical protein